MDLELDDHGGEDRDGSSFAGRGDLQEDADEEVDDQDEGVSAALDVGDGDAGLDVDLEVGADLGDDIDDGLELNFNAGGDGDIDRTAGAGDGVLCGEPLGTSQKTRKDMSLTNVGALRLHISVALAHAVAGSATLLEGDCGLSSGCRGNCSGELERSISLEN